MLCAGANDFIFGFMLCSVGHTEHELWYTVAEEHVQFSCVLCQFVDELFL